MTKLSVVIPVYNERATLAELLARVRGAPLPDGLSLEIVVVDDGSTDGSRELLESLIEEDGGEVRLYALAVNSGKGAALRRAFGEVEGDIVLVQDADLEYDPADYPVLLQPILDGRADAVFGSRFMSGPRRVLYFWHSVGNRLVTTLSNMLTDLNLSDMECCYKVVTRQLLDGLDLRSNRFGIEPELTAKIAKSGARIYEVPISYHGRTYAEGKKVGWHDGVAAIWWILRYNLGP